VACGLKVFLRFVVLGFVGQNQTNISADSLVKKWRGFVNVANAFFKDSVWQDI